MLSLKYVTIVVNFFENFSSENADCFPYRPPEFIVRVNCNTENPLKAKRISQV